MSLRAIKDLVYRAAHGIPTIGDWLDAAEAEIAALEKAAKTISVQGVHEEVGASAETMDAVDEADALMETIAKEAE